MEESVLSEDDYTEACRRYKDKRTKFHERQRYHALILVTQGYSYAEISRILLLTEEAIRHWVARYAAIPGRAETGGRPTEKKGSNRLRAGEPTLFRGRKAKTRKEKELRYGGGAVGRRAAASTDEGRSPWEEQHTTSEGEEGSRTMGWPRCRRGRPLTRPASSGPGSG